MKNLKKISLISFLACATLAGGILAANTEVETPVQEQKFWMETGAQIRVPDAVEEGQEDRDGIRFIAKMTDAYRVAKGDLDKMSVGMFFLPADKVNTINEAAVFGENATYYWKGCGYEQGDRLEIVHKETYAFEETPGDDFLTIKCSLWNLLPETLDREIGAVAYLRVNVATKEEEPRYEYHFATPAQGAKAVSVAQKALLNKKDEIHTVEGGADRVNAAYVNAYLESKGGSVEVPYKETVYKQQKGGSYAVVEEKVEKTATVTAYNTKVPTGMENYSFVDGWSTKDRALLFDGSTTVDSYYNYSANRAVIWDGETVDTYDSTYLDAYADSETVMTKEAGRYEGDALRLYLTDGYDGPAWSGGFPLPAATKKISMFLEVGLYHGQASKQPGFNNFCLYHTAKSTYMQPTSYTIVNLDTNETTVVDRNGGDFDLPTGRYSVTMEFDKEFSMIYCLCYRVKMTDAAPMYVDNICAEDIKVMGTTKVNHLYTDTISFAAPEVIDTTAWEGESDLVVSVQYKSNLASDYSNLTAKNGVYTITPDADAYKYEIVINGKSYTTVKGVSLINFNVPLEERSYMFTGEKSSTGKDGTGEKDEGANAAFKIVQLEGDKYMTVNAKGWWAYANKKKVDKNTDNNIESVAGFTPTKIGVWVYAPSATTVDLYNYGINGDQYGNERNVPVDAGYSYVEYTFAKTLEGTYAVGFGFGTNMSLYIQEIVLIA